MKWADFCISKLSFVESSKLISEVYVHVDNNETIGLGEIRDRNWLVQQAYNGKSFCCITKTKDGKWQKLCDFRFENGSFKWDGTLPKVLTRRKSFISYYHKDNQNDRTKFKNLFGDLIVSKSVEDGDIDSDNSDEYIKQLIQKDFLADTTVLVVLIGPKTKCRKHVDWEISGALNLKVGGNNSGLLGILLPSHPDFGTGKATHSLLPSRLDDNFKSGYAVIRDWTDDRVLMQSYIEEAFANRTAKAKDRINSRIQMNKDTCE